MMHKSGIFAVVTVLLIVAVFCPAAYADQNEALITAIRKGDLKQVQQLLKKGADVNAQDEHGSPALVLAAESDYRGRMELVKLLLEKGADVNAKDQVGHTALMKAAEAGRLEVIKLLLDRGADVNATDPQYGRTPLMVAAEAGHSDVVRLLVEKGAEINAKDNFGDTALKMAAGKRHMAIAELLLINGADVNATDKRCVTALMAAAGLGEFDIVELLLNKGAQLSAKDREGRTALEHAATGNHRRIVDLLSSRGAQTNLAAAAMVGDTTEVQRFLKEGADVNAKDDQGKTALILAVERGHLEVVKLLLENHADVNAKTSNGQTALDIAQRGSNEIYTVLRSNGAKTREGLRILKYADKVLRRGDELFVRLADGRIISRKDKPPEPEDSIVRYEFSDFIEPWYVIDESYYECTGRQLLHGDSGKSVTVYGRGIFSPDRMRLLSLGCPGDSWHVEIWKMTNSGPVKEYVHGGCHNSFRWADPSTVEVATSDDASNNTVIGRYTLDAATGKWSCSEQDLEEMGTGKMCGDATDDLDYALRDAVDEGDLEAVKTLLEKGANVNAKGQLEKTVLVDAAWKGHLEIVKLLLAKGAGTSESEKAEALVHAACHKEVVELLISHGAKLTLPVAAAIGDLKAIKRLIKDGADVNAENKDVDSAFYSAVDCNQWDAAILLLKNGAQIQDAYWLTAAAKDGHSGMIRTLLKKETIAKEKLLPALDMAASEGKLEIVQLLLAKGADANGKDKYGRTPLMAAVIKGQQATAHFLLAKGADANARDLDGATALMDAAWGANPQMIKLLLKKNVEVNATDADGLTALQYAKLSKNEEIVEFLKAHGAKE